MGHVGWSQEGGFEIRNIPPELKQIFKEAGIKKKDLKDEETLTMVMGIVNEHQKSAETSQSPSISNGPPPPPPTGGGPPPPPPPPPPPGGPKMSGGPPKSGGPPPPPQTSGGSDGRSDLLSQIRGGTTLRPVEERTIDVSRFEENQKKSLVDTLASAMAMRRNDMLLEGQDDDDDDDEWSD